MAHYEEPEGMDVEYSAATDYLNFNVKGHKVHMRHEASTQTETPSARAKFGGGGPYMTEGVSIRP